MILRSSRCFCPSLKKFKLQEIELMTIVLKNSKRDKQYARMTTLNTRAATRPEAHAFWSKQHLPSSPAPSSLDEKSIFEGTHVLMDILKVLQKMDTKLEGQNKRLDTLESMSPSSSNDSTLLGSNGLSRRQSTRTAVSHGSVDEIDDYGRSLSLKRMPWETLSFVESEVEDVEVDKDDDASSSGNNNQGPGNWGELRTESMRRGASFYSISVYPSEALGSQMNMSGTRAATPLPIEMAFAPQASQLPELEADMQITPTEQQMPSAEYMYVPSIEYSTTPLEANIVEQRKPAMFQISVEKSPKAPHHWRVELSFYAYGNWKRGVVAKIKNETRSIRKTEKQRVADLRNRYRSRNWVSRVLDQIRSAFEREWREEEERLRSLMPGDGIGSGSGSGSRGKSNLRGAFW